MNVHHEEPYIPQKRDTSKVDGIHRSSTAKKQPGSTKKVKAPKPQKNLRVRKKIPPNGMGANGDSALDGTETVPAYL